MVGPSCLASKCSSGHQVPEEKAEALDVPWLELLAEEILEYQPRLPHRNRHAPTPCPACHVLVERLAKRSEDNRARNRVETEYEAEAQRIGRTWNSILAAAKTHSRISAGRRRA
jgi:hypothetical protein